MGKSRNSRKFDFDVIVIGSGASGAVAAEILAAREKKVALIEASEMGGYVPNFGDIPRRAALTSAHEFAKLAAGAKLGLRTNTVGYNFPAIREWKNLAIRRSGVKKTAEYLRSKNVEFLRGRAHFISRNEITLGLGTDRRHISAEKFLIASGAHDFIPKIIGLENVDFLTSETALEQNRPPKSLAIVGAGATGVELAEFFAIFGTKVYLFEQNSRILSDFDAEVSDELSRTFAKKYGAEILTSAKITEAKNDGPIVRINFSRGGTEKSLKVEKLLIAAGGAPNTDIGLVSAGVKFDENGVETDENLMTNVKNIYAAGAVISRKNHEKLDVASAIFEGEIAAWNLFHRDKKSAFSRPQPKIIATFPSVASVGLTEEKLIKNRVKYKKSVVENSVVARANFANEAQGFAKILAGQKGEILGATIVSPTASESIEIFALAIGNNLRASDLAATIQPFGSWNEALKLALLRL